MNNANDAPSEESATESQIAQPSIKPKKSLTKYIWLGMIVLLGVILWYGYKLVNPESAGPRIHPLSLVPPDAMYVLETDRPYELWTEISQTSIWDLLQHDQEWQEFGQVMSELENTLSGFDQALDILTNRTVYVSAHPYRSKASDLLFIVDLEGLGMLQTWMTSFDQVTKRTFEGQTIFEKFDVETKETLFFVFLDNYLVASYTHTLVESSLKNMGEAALRRSFDFIDVRKKVLNEGLVRFYVNYESLLGFLGEVIGKQAAQGVQNDLPFLYSGFYFDVDKNLLLLEGYSNYQDTLSTYLNLFPTSGTGGTDIANIIPDKTSVYLSLGFDSFHKFYQSLITQLNNDPASGESYLSYAAKTEKYLGIDIADDLTAWVDDEIAVIQFELENSSETAFIMKAKSADKAVEKMAFLSHQIRRKTPVRFRTVDYRGHQINFMAVKGLFNLILGNLFTKFDRPYFTIIDEFVVFSDKPKVLRRMIDQKLDDKTLANVPSYQQFIKALGQEHSALIYIQPDLLGNSNGGLVDKDMAELLKAKSKLLVHFPQLGINISPAGEMFETKLLFSIEGISDEEMLYYSPVLSNINLDSLFQMDPGEQIEIGEIEIEDLAAEKQSEAYAEGAPKYEVELKNGLKHGDYFEYHPTGELKIKGKYKNDLKEGTWKYYSVDGKLIKKEKYKKGEL